MAYAHQVNSLFERLSAQYGKTCADEIAAIERRCVTVRVNSLKADAEEVRLALLSAGIGARPVGWYSSALILDCIDEREVQRLPVYSEGKIYLQSLSSMLPPLCLDPQAGESILDMTAAPGGKTTELYALSGGKALITACERDKIRFERLKFNLERQGASRVTPLCVDALLLDDYFSFDKILLDAPCTGSGTATLRNPVEFSENYLKKCVKKQENLLKKALKLLKKGGTLVYSTCSVLPEENGELLARALPESGGRIVPLDPFEGIPTFPTAPGTITVRPDSLYEGFFVAKIQK